jgi:hypothetical protein
MIHRECSFLIEHPPEKNVNLSITENDQQLSPILIYHRQDF